MSKDWEPADLRQLPLFYLRMGKNGQHRKVYPQAVQERLRELYKHMGDSPQEMEYQLSADERGH